MRPYTIDSAQAEMRTAYRNGAPGVAASGLVWSAAALTALLNTTPTTAIWVLLIGGMFIHPLGLLLTKLTAAPATHSPANSLGKLAIEGTFWMFAGIAIAFGVQSLRPDWFFPSMLLIIGGRYLTFQTICGLSLYWILGALFCPAGIALALYNARPQRAD